ncbi:regulator [Streptomyces sp. NPDC057002]|uniref:regulator n=1 Tax=Streptomyces sp. NPDC057002 TaxID=3345992 RepID=UPI00363ECDF9
MSTPLTSADAQRIVEVLASRPLVRLVSEIDDNGAIAPRRLAGTLPDLSTHQLRSASDTARALGLVRLAPGAGLELTEAGMELADLYDAIARWARRHAVPALVSEFSSRIRCVLDLLAPSLTTERADGAEVGLARLHTLLIQWLADNPHVARMFEPEPVA